MAVIKSNSKIDSYYMPAEWQKHYGTVMLWPTRSDNWRNDAKYAQKVFFDVAVTIAKYEKVFIGVESSLYYHVYEMFSDYNVEVFTAEYDDVWIRDTGPTFITSNSCLKAIDWQFNAWGGDESGIYSSWDKDNEIAKIICNKFDVAYCSTDFILEGGSIVVDGEGTAIVTEACLLSKSRNAQYSKAEIEDILKKNLKLEKIIWIPNGIYLDETNEHVDNIVQFCNIAELFLAWCDDDADPQYQMSMDAYKILSNETDAKGRRFKIHKLHIPNILFRTKVEADGVSEIDGSLPRRENERLCASYVNFCFVNDAVIVPLFNDEFYDNNALCLFKKVFPNKKIEGIYSREILLGGGNIHCITLHIPDVLV